MPADVYHKTHIICETILHNHNHRKTALPCQLASPYNHLSMTEKLTEYTDQKILTWLFQIAMIGTTGQPGKLFQVRAEWGVLEGLIVMQNRTVCLIKLGDLSAFMHFFCNLLEKLILSIYFIWFAVLLMAKACISAETFVANYKHKNYSFCLKN